MKTSNNLLEHIDDNNLYDDDPADTSTDSSGDSDEDDDDANNNMQMRKNIAKEIAENKRIREEIQAGNAIINEIGEHLNPVDQHKPEDLLYAEKAPIGALPTKWHQTRSKGPVDQPTVFKDGRSWVSVAQKAYKRLNKAIFHASLTVQQKNQFGVYSNMTVRQAIDRLRYPHKTSSDGSTQTIN
jgi:hypothetical protein